MYLHYNTTTNNFLKSNLALKKISYQLFKIFLGCLIFYSNSCFSQNYLPEIIHYYNANEGYYWGIPTVNENEKLSFRTNYSGYTGVRNVIYSAYSNIVWQQKKYIIGGDLLYSQIGDYINNTQLRLLYGYKINLSSEITMIQSVNMGYTNLSLGGGSGVNGSSVFKPDLTLGNMVKYKNTSIGFAYEHILNPKFQPFTKPLYYKQKLNFIFSNKKTLGLNRYSNYFTTTINYNIKREKYQQIIDYNICDEFEFNRYFKLGVNLYNIDLLGFGGGVSYKLEKYISTLELYYFSNLSEENINSNRYQLRLKFFIE